MNKERFELKLHVTIQHFKCVIENSSNMILPCLVRLLSELCACLVYYLLYLHTTCMDPCGYLCGISLASCSYLTLQLVARLPLMQIYIQPVPSTLMSGHQMTYLTMNNPLPSTNGWCLVYMFCFQPFGVHDWNLYTFLHTMISFWTTTTMISKRWHLRDST